MYPRFLAARIREALADTPVVFLEGARQVGKSTLVRSLGVGRYLTLDDPLVRSAAAQDPLAFLLAQGEEPLILDEVQRVPELLLSIKRLVDLDRRPGRFLLTGSANVLALPRVAEALVGRMEVLTLWPLSEEEVRGRRGFFLEILFSQGFPTSWRTEAEDLESLVRRGGFPEAVKREGRRRLVWFRSYLRTLLERDVRDLARIQRLETLPRLLEFLAFRLAQPLNQSELARLVGLPLSTLREYLALLEALFLVVRFPAWAANPEKRLVKAPKLYLVDTGLAASLLGGEDRFGFLLENFVALELLKHAGFGEVEPRFYHFRTHTGQEVDLVLEWEGRVVGLEVKAAKSLSARDFSGLRALREAAGERFFRGAVLYGGQEVLAVEPGLYAVPIPALWRLE
ncbi:ATP-binding protein [Thermus filiformis]|uniref:ATPase AAA n=1 Tax=Thermus filiformis TaxID=276 RepID=A0A0A2WRJ2_THEFI|nr:ATP-binding protein [Thermus filiformis]KGQ20930.1 ATPase AAA [Thermus filiformis]